MQSDNDISFSDYYVAYFDILGYKSYFSEKAEKSLEFVKSIESAITKTKNMINNNKKSNIITNFAHIQIDYRIFSDNILLCMQVTDTPLEKIRLLIFLQIVCDIQRGFIFDYGLFLRGGVTKGSFLITENSIHGQALIECVNMEETAVYPRILVSDLILNFIKESPSYISSQNNRIDNLIEKIKSDEQLLENEEMELLTYKQYLQLELSIKEWYLSLVVRKEENDSPFLNYLYDIDIEKIFPQYINQIKDLPQIITNMKPLSEYELSILENNIKINQPEALKNMMIIHKNKCETKINEWCNYCNIDKPLPKNVELRKRIIQKYLWVIDFHNILCSVYKLPEFIIQVSAIYNDEVQEYDFKCNDNSINLS